MDEKPLFWFGAAHEVLLAMPEDVKDVFRYSLDLAQRGERHPKAKLFRLPSESGVKGSGNVYEDLGYSDAEFMKIKSGDGGAKSQTITSQRSCWKLLAA